MGVPADVGEPFLFHLELREGSFDDELPAAVVDEIDLTGDAAGKRDHRCGGISNHAVGKQQPREVTDELMERRGVHRRILVYYRRAKFGMKPPLVQLAFAP